MKGVKIVIIQSIHEVGTKFVNLTHAKFQPEIQIHYGYLKNFKRMVDQMDRSMVGMLMVAQKTLKLK